MRDRPVTMPAAGESLLERAAQVYDFNAHLRNRAAAHGPAAQGPAVADAGLPGVPAEFLAAGDHEAFTPPPLDASAGAIDRAMLAERGMIVPGAPVGPLAEEFRLVKRHVLGLQRLIAEGEGAERARTVLVCSARPGDGKTFCAINLALSIAAERDTEALLVDADFAKPDVCARLGLPDGRGLLDALDDAGLDPESLVIETDVPGLSVLPAGTRTTADTELLASARTRAVIARLLAANPRRVVVFDSPPALAASPAAVLAAHVGQVALVVRADRTADGDLREAIGLLDGCEHIQLLLNGVSFTPGGRRFGDYHGQGDAR